MGYVFFNSFVCFDVQYHSRHGICWWFREWLLSFCPASAQCWSGFLEPTCPASIFLPHFWSSGLGQLWPCGTTPALHSCLPAIPSGKSSTRLKSFPDVKAIKTKIVWSVCYTFCYYIVCILHDSICIWSIKDKFCTLNAYSYFVHFVTYIIYRYLHMANLAGWGMSAFLA